MTRKNSMKSSVNYHSDSRGHPDSHGEDGMGFARAGGRLQYASVSLAMVSIASRDSGQEAH